MFMKQMNGFIIIRFKASIIVERVKVETAVCLSTLEELQTFSYLLVDALL